MWEELNTLLLDVVPAEASGEEALAAIMAAVSGMNTEITDLYRRVVTLSRADSGGYIRQRMGEDNPISAVRRRLGQSGEHLGEGGWN